MEFQLTDVKGRVSQDFVLQNEPIDEKKNRVQKISRDCPSVRTCPPPTELGPGLEPEPNRHRIVIHAKLGEIEREEIMKEISKIEEMGGIVGDRKYERLKDG